MAKYVGRVSSPVDQMIMVVSVTMLRIMGAVVIGVAEAKADILVLRGMVVTMRMFVTIAIGVVTMTPCHRGEGGKAVHSGGDVGCLLYTSDAADE